MKVKLFSLAALILLSAISSIFNAMPIIGVSAQDYGTVDDGSYYNADTGYNNFDPYLGQQNADYSSYNSYGPPDPNYYGDGSAEYTSYDNSYEDPSMGGYMDDSYLTGDPGLYGNQYDNNYYDEGSYDSKYPPKKVQKFTCPDSGLVVDKPESCPLICPVGSTLAGHFVAAGSNLTQICNVDKQVLETCPAGTDLENVFVTDATPEICNIFATCPATTPLGQALGLTGTATVEVADAQLCNLRIPPPTPPTQIFVCPSTATTDVPFPNPEMAGQNVTSLELCMVATPAVLCQDGTTLNGTWVHPNSTQTCNLVIPPPTIFPTCPAAPGNNPALVGAQVTDLRLCQAPTTPNICPPTSDLAGVYANNTLTDCDLTFPSPGPAFIANNTEAQCIKCADLAIQNASNNFNELRAEVNRLIGTTSANIFAACDDANPRIGFNALSNSSVAEQTFDTCLDNAGVKPGNSTSGPRVQSLALSLQESSLTTNVQPQAEIPTISESVQALESALQGNSITTNAQREAEIQMSPPSFSPPTTAQETGGSSSAVEKMTKLKQQWLGLLP